MILTTTLSMAAAAAIINLWLGIRCGQVRAKAKVIHGDGGNPLLMQRMRAQSNFIENTPLAVILVGLVELAGRRWRACSSLAALPTASAWTSPALTWHAVSARFPPCWCSLASPWSAC